MHLLQDTSPLDTVFLLGLILNSHIKLDWLKTFFQKIYLGASGAAAAAPTARAATIIAVTGQQQQQRQHQQQQRQQQQQERQQ
jgi:hypothetical protein